VLGPCPLLMLLLLLLCPFVDSVGKRNRMLRLGQSGAFGTGHEFTLLAATCVRKAEDAKERAARTSAAGTYIVRNCRGL